MGRFQHIVNVASIQRQLATVKEVHHSVQANVGHAAQFYLQPETKQRIGWRNSARKPIALRVYLLLTFLLHAQGEHSMEVWAGNSQQGSVSRDLLVVRHQDHVAEFPVLPLFIEALQDLHRLIHTVENLQQISKKEKKIL